MENFRKLVHEQVVEAVGDDIDPVKIVETVRTLGYGIAMLSVIVETSGIHDMLLDSIFEAIRADAKKMKSSFDNFVAAETAGDAILKAMHHGRHH